MASSAFQLLSMGGASFNKQKYKKDLDLFSGKQNKSKKQKKEVDISATSGHLPAGLDFFGSSAAAGPSSTKVKTEKTSKVKVEADSEEESDSDEEDVPSVAPPSQKINLSGPEPLPRSFASFDEVVPSSHSVLLRNLRKDGVTQLWGVQGAVSGAMMAKEQRDVLVIAPTGSGKTLSYLLPLALKLDQPCRIAFNAHKKAETKDAGEQGIRSIVLVPTHELALQIYGEVQKLLQGNTWRTLLLEKSTEMAIATSGQAGQLGIDVLVATPERLHAMIEAGKVDMKGTRYLILDEADRLIGPDFLPQVEPIIDGHTHARAQKVMLSATMEAGPEALARTWLKDDGVRIVVGLKDAPSTTVTQHLQFCGSEMGKLLALRNDIAAGKLPAPVLIFVQSIERANELYQELVMDGMRVGAVHGEKSKAEREKTVREFREGKLWMLVVTELMARGLDFKGIEVVVNYDFPQTVGSYVHRIGRAGRAGRTGSAITYFTLEDGPYLRTIANVMKSSGCKVEPWMLELPKPSKNLKKERRRKPVERKDIGGAGKNLARKDAKNRRAMIEASMKRKLKSGGKMAAGGASSEGGAGIAEVDLSE